MSGKLPFEKAIERQMDHVPLPDENASWQKMQELLDKKKKRRFFAFFGWYLGYSVVFIVLLLATWLLIHFSGNTGNKSSYQLTKGQRINKITSRPDSFKDEHTTLSLSQSSATDTTAKVENIRSRTDKLLVIDQGVRKATKQQKLHKRKKGSALHGWVNTGTKNGRRKRYLFGSKRINNTYHNLDPRTTLSATKIQQAINADTALRAEKRSAFGDTSVNALNDQKNLPSVLSKDTAFSYTDSTAKDTSATKKPSLSTNKFTLSAGIGLQQQIPLFGQKLVSYGMNGNSVLADYIPSVYVRFEKDHAWFLQGEFIYAAPQLVKEFSYNRSGYADSSTGTTLTNSSNVVKTFYNQVPVILNYYIHPHWSAGAGATYSWFHSAVTESVTELRQRPAQVVSVTKSIIPVRAGGDTSMFKTHLNLLVQTDYQWHRFSAGLRFTKDVEPYIKYTMPDGTKISRRNWSLGLTLRFAMWKSATF